MLRSIVGRFFPLFFLSFVFLGQTVMLLCDALFPLTDTLAAFWGMTTPVKNGMNGSGDSTYAYVHLCFVFIIAITGSIIWASISKFCPPRPQTLHKYSVFLRYYLASILWTYGSTKLFKNQFPEASLVRLSESIGDSSPMGLAWTYMGYSPLYNFFAGSLECIGGGLLLFPQTVLLGSLLNLGVMGHVLIMNLSFDIPVKINSSFYCLISLYLIWPHRQGLLDFFILNRTVLARETPLPIPATGSIFKKVSKAFLVLAFMSLIITMDYSQSELFHPSESDPTLTGVYTVRSSSHALDSQLSRFTDRWQQIIIDYPTLILIRTHDQEHWLHYQRIRDNSMDLFLTVQGQTYFAETRFDHTARSTRFQGKFCKISEDAYHYDKESKSFNYSRLQLIKNCRQAEQETIEFTTLRKQKSDYLLVNRGFHWINEAPFNR